MKERSTTNQHHDRGHRLLFSHPRTIKDLLEGFVEEPWVKELDFTTLRRLPADYVSAQLAGDFEARAGDVLWQIDWKHPDQEPKRRPLHLLILLEFQSTCDLTMAVRMLVYVGLLYQRLIKERPLRRGELLPPVLPMVLYNGQRPWNAPLDVADLIAPGPPSLDSFRPRLRYHLIDEKRCPLDLLESLENVTAAIFRASRDRGPEDLREVVRQLCKWLSGPTEQALKRDLTAWISKSVLASRLPEIELPEIQNLDDFQTVLENFMQTWTQKWFQDGFLKGEQRGFLKGEQRGFLRGEQKGEARGYAKAVLQLVERKFGAPELSLRQKVEQAEPDQLRDWLDQLAVANRLDEVFAGF